jgi:hypothetical protein
MDQEQNNKSEIERSAASEIYLESPLSIGTPWRLFLFSALLFLFALFVFFGLKVGYKNYLNNQIGSLDKKLENLSNSIKQEDQKKFIDTYSQIINLQTVLGNHVFSHNIFSFLEKNTLSKVFYKSAKFASLPRTLTLEGEAESLQMLSLQMARFEESEEVEKAVLSNMGFKPNGSTSFTINLVFKSKYLSSPL